jgi:hypothetical protein
MKHRGSGGFAAMKRWSARLFERLRRDEAFDPHGFSSGFAAMKRLVRTAFRAASPR